MTPEEALQVADELLLAHAGNPLTDIQRMILQESLAGKGYESMEGYAPQHIKNEGKKLWDLLSEALGEKVSKTSFKGSLEKRLKSGGMVPQPPQPSNYDEQTWTGRETAVNTLLLKLQGQTHILWLTGISGIGKTALGECLASQAWKNDPSFQWIYVEILEGQNKDFASVAADLLAKLGDRDLDPQERNNPEQLAKRLLKKLQVHPYWIQLDALERLLDPEQPIEFVDGYWTTFLQRCLTESNLISRLVLTAQALPNALVDFSDRYPNTWAEIQLGGLSEVHQRLEFFTKRGVVVEESNREILTRIAAIYEGHPLVMKVIAEDILKEFSGNVLHYWQVNQREFEQVARELQDARLDETEYNEALDRKVRERIKKSLEQLPGDALDLLCRSSVFRRPVPRKFWLAMTGNPSIKQQKAAYRVLDDRALIEKEGIHIRQHNLIRDIAYDLLREDKSIFEIAERRAAEVWLTDYKPILDALNLQRVQGYIESFHHFCQVQDWSRAGEILKTSINTSTNEPLYVQLQSWGYYQELVQLYKRILYKLSPEQSILWLKSLGNAYYILGNYPLAIESNQQSLRIAREIGDRQGEAKALGNLGLINYSLDKYPEAIEDIQCSLSIFREIDDYKGQIPGLANLCLIYGIMGNVTQAVGHCEQALNLARETYDRRMEVIALEYLSSLYANQGNHSQAFDYSQQALKIAHEIGDRLREEKILINLGINFFDLGNNSQAIKHYQQSLDIAREIGDRQGESNVLHHFAKPFIKLGQYSKALELLQSSLRISKEIGSRWDEAYASMNLAELYHKTNQSEQARKCCKQALRILKQLEISPPDEWRDLKEILEKDEE